MRKTMTEEEIIKQYNIWKQKKVREKRRLYKKEWNKEHPNYYKEYMRSEKGKRKRRETEASESIRGKRVRKQNVEKIISLAKRRELLNKEDFEQEEYDLKRFNEIKKYTDDTNES